MLENSIGELLVLIFMAQALALDAFSVCLGLGMQQLRLKRILWISLIIGAFHIIMPFIGILLGKMASAPFESYAQLISSMLLIFIGAQMFFSAFTEEKKMLIQPIGIGLLILAFTVSMDSFTVGFGLGLAGVKVVLALILFGLSSAFLSGLALLIGRHVQGVLGRYSELLGGSILVGFGLYVLFA
ncbi:manganese efflux pump MntP family protein [Oceanobacillus luteolus]|uniref:Putative manganese efflux pump MntP n=1 Tax=Oceanobacillus luteolus TaxID=1274358 RepID=A0ABW4HM14_9BACI|nr:manganese efflux pump MntP family protein [Oceanobacillus luteolus]MCM3741473.1 manganese efflux pump MntP family protein [Oceanobacillus luteolus]